MNKEQAEKAGEDIINCLSKICEKENEWCRNVIRATENTASEGAREIRTTATNEISRLVAYYQTHINQIHQILDAAHFKEPQKSIIGTPSALVSRKQLFDAIENSNGSGLYKIRAIDAINQVLSCNVKATDLLSYENIVWMDCHNVGERTADFIVETLAGLRSPA